MTTYLPPGITTSDIGGVSGTGADNRIPTFTDATNIQGEANLTFDGSTLTVTGAVTVGSDGSGQDVTFYSETGGDHFVWDAGAEKLTITGTNGATALDVADGNVTITGDLAVDGTSNLDAVDIDGNVQLDGTFTVGATTDGYDVKFWGNTSNTYMLWDENTDDLVLTLGAELYFYDAAGGEHIKSDGTDMTIYAGNDLNLTAVTDINIPSAVGLTFGNDGEKIEGDGTNLTIESSAILNLNATGNVYLRGNSGGPGEIRLTSGNVFSPNTPQGVDLGDATNKFSSLYIGNNVYTLKYHEFTEMSAPGAGAANTARIYAYNPSAALTAMAAVFQDGTVDKFATEATELDSPIFTQPTNTSLTLRMRKPHPGLHIFEVVFPNGEAFTLREFEHHDTAMMGASVNCESDSLPSGWLSTTPEYRAAHASDDVIAPGI